MQLDLSVYFLRFTLFIFIFLIFSLLFLFSPIFWNFIFSLEILFSVKNMLNHIFLLEKDPCVMVFFLLLKGSSAMHGQQSLTCRHGHASSAVITKADISEERDFWHMFFILPRVFFYTTANCFSYRIKSVETQVIVPICLTSPNPVITERKELCHLFMRDFCPSPPSSL